MSSIFDSSQEKTNFTRLARLLIDGGTEALRKVFNSFIPTSTLQTVLNKNLALLETLKRKGKIFDGQWEQLFPSTGDPPDSTTFDITLLHLLLRVICDSIEPVTGWNKMPEEADGSLEANIVRIKCFRNDLCHSISTDIHNAEFEDKWNKISQALAALGLDQQEIDRLKTDPIDHDTKRRVDEEVGKWKLDFEPRVQNLEEEVQQLKMHIQGPKSGRTVSCELSSCLPDEVQDVFGRSQEIQQVIEAVQNGKVPISVITGGPGFGKTTVANKVAHELAKCERSVLYCSLASKITLKDVATTMILTCSKSHSHPPENPEHWLLNWSKQLTEKVTFVLDNADDIVESGSRDQFVDMLREMRSLSNVNLTFVITSRKTVNAPNYEFKIVNIRLACLSADEASGLLLSKVQNAGARQKLSQTAKIVKLCGYVPLALCIVGSLLSDYKEDRLIKSLEKEPLDVLQDDEISIEKAIKTSFDLLNKAEQEALAFLSIFPGSFDFDAAEAVITAEVDTGAQPVVRILRSLKNRSLLEQPSSCRYEVHQLIQAFAKKVSKDRFSRDVVQAEEMACAHFISRLADNANMFWSKDKCKESIEAFNVDRHNFEYFLNFYVHEKEQRDVDCLQSSTCNFLDNFPQKCMYLEMCLLPSFYVLILEKLLNHFEAGNQPVRTVEILCLLGHEKRKVGNQKQYKDLMKRAKLAYAKNCTEFKTNGLSRVFFFNSYARFLSETLVSRDRKWELTNKVYEIALILCRKNLNEHPETAATLLFMGRPQKSVLHLEEARALFELCLGEHFMTAQSHKAIADFYFVRGTDMNSTDEEKVLYIDKSSEHYQEALTMTEKLGMGGHKESILTLKNYGLCHKVKGNFEEAINLLLKAKRVADIELEDDHKWKVMIETQLALLYDCVGRAQEAKEVMKKGLEMNKRLKRYLSQLANKFEIRLFLKCHPDTFL